MSVTVNVANGHRDPEVGIRNLRSRQGKSKSEIEVGPKKITTFPACEAAVFRPAANLAPTAISALPSPFKSPMATESPKSAKVSNDGSWRTFFRETFWPAKTYAAP